jgi:hypothetical protein
MGCEKSAMSPLLKQFFPNLLKSFRSSLACFSNDSIGSWFGYDTKNGVYEAVGSADAKVSFTSVGDVGKVLAAIAGMSRSRSGEGP